MAEWDKTPSEIEKALLGKLHSELEAFRVAHDGAAFEPQAQQGRRSLPGNSETYMQRDEEKSPTGLFLHCSTQPNDLTGKEGPTRLTRELLVAWAEGVLRQYPNYLCVYDGGNNILCAAARQALKPTEAAESSSSGGGGNADSKVVDLARRRLLRADGTVGAKGGPRPS